MSHKLLTAGIRAELDVRNKSLKYKIREQQRQQISYMLVLVGREVEAGAVAVRHLHQGDQGSLPVAEFIAKVQAEASTDFADPAR